MPESPTQAGPPSVAVLIEALAADAGDRVVDVLVNMTSPRVVLPASSCSTRPFNPKQENCSVGTTACRTEVSIQRRCTTG